MAVAQSSLVADHSLVCFVGECDLSTLPALSSMLADAIARDDRDVVVDLSGVQFIDCSTLGLLLRARSILRPRSRSLTVRSPSTRARVVLDACGLTQVFGQAPH